MSSKTVTGACVASLPACILFKILQHSFAPVDFPGDVTPLHQYAANADVCRMFHQFSHHSQMILAFLKSGARLPEKMFLSLNTQLFCSRKFSREERRENVRMLQASFNYFLDQKLRAGTWQEYLIHLTPLQRSLITSVTLSHLKSEKDQKMLLEALPNVRNVRFVFSSVTDQKLKNVLQWAPTIRRFAFLDCSVTLTGQNWDFLQLIEELAFEETRISTSDLGQMLYSCSSLHVLELGRMHQQNLTQLGNSLKDPINIRVLYVKDLLEDSLDEGLKVLLPKLPHLEKLSCMGCVHMRGTFFVEVMPNLRELDVSRTAINDDVFTSILVLCPGLAILRANNCRITAANAFSKQHLGLREVYLDDTDVSRETAKACMANCPNLALISHPRMDDEASAKAASIWRGTALSKL